MKDVIILVVVRDVIENGKEIFLEYIIVNMDCLVGVMLVGVVVKKYG